MRKLPKVCILIPYYGKWPIYFNIFLTSCRYNHVIDIIFFTDLEKPKSSPSNVKFYNLSFIELRRLVNKKLGREFYLSKPYKLCDYRPAYGLIFEDYVKEYDFWGYGDIDLVYGQMGKFLSEDVLQHYDVVSLRQEWCSGSFSLLRNTKLINTLFLNDARYVEVFNNEAFCGFDECAKLFLEVKSGLDLLNNNEVAPNFTNILLNAQFEEKIKVHFKTLIKESINPGEVVSWDKGMLVCNNRDYLLYHYITEKKKYSFFFPRWTEVPDCFFIDDTGFFTEKELKKRNFIRFGRKIKGLYLYGLDVLPRAKRRFLKKG